MRPSRTEPQEALFSRRFELFRDDPTEPAFIASFDDLGLAKEVMEAIALSTPGRYLVWIPSEGEVVAQLFG